jgi:ubiquinone/menaquinone biosynthesis C-methylase UbiE
METCIAPGRIAEKMAAAADFNEIAKTIFFPIYPVIAHQILKKTDISTGSCLDIGTGPGHLAIALATLSDLTVYALDNNEAMHEIAEANVAKYRLGRRVRPVLGDVSSLPFGTGSMNLVVSRGSFFFWEDLSRGFSECMRVLRPGGMAYIGGGFGNARLRDEIVKKMRSRDPFWEEERRERYRKCSPSVVRSALAGAGIAAYDLNIDDSGYWVRFGKTGTRNNLHARRHQDPKKQ